MQQFHKLDEKLYNLNRIKIGTLTYNISWECKVLYTYILGLYNNGKNQVFAHNPHYAKKLNLSVSSIKRYLNTLQHIGLIKVTRKKDARVITPFEITDDLLKLDISNGCDQKNSNEKILKVVYKSPDDEFTKNDFHINYVSPDDVLISDESLNFDENSTHLAVQNEPISVQKEPGGGSKRTVGGSKRTVGGSKRTGWRFTSDPYNILFYRDNFIETNYGSNVEEALLGAAHLHIDKDLVLNLCKEYVPLSPDDMYIVDQLYTYRKKENPLWATYYVALSRVDRDKLNNFLKKHFKEIDQKRMDIIHVIQNKLFTLKQYNQFFKKINELEVI